MAALRGLRSRELLACFAPTPASLFAWFSLVGLVLSTSAGGIETRHRHVLTDEGATALSASHNSHPVDYPVDPWLLDWVPTESSPDRRVVNVRLNYFSSGQSKKWLQCARKHRFLDPERLNAPSLRPGTKILMLGNSFMRQLAENLIMGIPDERIESMFFEYHTPEQKKEVLDRFGMSESDIYYCPCPLAERDDGRIEPYCKLVDVFHLANNRRESGNFTPVWCDSHVFRSPVTDAAEICGDNSGLVNMKDGTVIAQLINSPLNLIPLEDAVEMAFNMTLGTFDLVIANRGNTYGGMRHDLCKTPLMSLPQWFQEKMDHDEGMSTKLIRPNQVAESLAKSGFQGTLYYTSDYIWQPISSSLMKAWVVQAHKHGIIAQQLQVFDKGNYRSVLETCKATECSHHACTPGESILMVQWMLSRLADDLAHHVRD